MSETQEDKQPVPGSDEYNQMMANKAREAREGRAAAYDESLTGGQQEPAQEPAQEASEVPAKFLNEDGTVNVEALVKSYTELEKARGKSQDDDKTKVQIPEKQEETEDAAEAAVQKANLDYNDLQRKVAEKGDLDESDYTAFKEAGVPEELVRDFIRLKQSEVQAANTKILEVFGGEDEGRKALQWAADNLSQEEVDGFNAMFGGPNYMAAARALKAQYDSSKRGAEEPKLKTPGVQAGSSASGYTSREEQRADMRDPLYREPGPKGDQFRAMVAQKTALATFRQR